VSAVPAPDVPGGPDDARVTRALQVATLGFVALHVWHATAQGGGGWRARHGGLLGAIRAFFVQSADDPVMSAGLSDFVVVAVVLGTTLVYELPPELRGTWRAKALLGIYAVFPGLGALLLVLWTRSVGRAAA
jgi:hypothetical protein